ncbi:MAG: ABC transporter permease [Silvibacterium sp.]
MILRDFRHALHQLLHMPGFTVTAILTLALGIGANTAIFSVVNAVLRHPAGVDHPERIVIQNTRYKRLGMDFPGVSVPDYADAASLHNLVEAAAIGKTNSFNIEHDGTVEHISAAQVSSQWFQVFGARPILGRTFTAEEDQPNAGPVAVISYGLWQRVFGGERDVVGKTILLDQKPYQILGVMRSDFDWPRGEKIWTPIALPPTAFTPNQRFNEGSFAILRLRPGVSVAQLNAALGEKALEEYRREGKVSFGERAQWSMYSSQLTEFAAGPLRKPLYVLFGVVLLVLLIASANVAGLFLARASTRTREFAIRTALGASASAIVRQTLTETMLLAGVATILGIATGPIFGKLLLWLIPHSLAQGYTVRLEPAVLAFTAAVGLLTALIAAVGPTLRLARQHQHLKLHDGGRSATASAEKQHLRSAFVIGEVALAFLLLTGTGLFLVSLRQLQHVDPGFNPHGVMAATVDYSGQDFTKNQARQAVFVDSVLNNMAAQPGVSAVAAIDPLPFDPQQGGSSSFDIVGRPTGPNDPGPHSGIALTTSGYLKVMRIPLLAGRWISPEDQANTESVVVIDNRLAKKYWPGQSPIGQHLSNSNGSGKPAVIVGVVATIRSNSLEEDLSDGVRYYALPQTMNNETNFVVRTSGDPAALAPVMQRAIASADSAQTASDIQPLEDLVSDSLAGRRLIVDMLAAFASLALLLAIVGIYGLISYITTQRTNEVGIRMALGAQRIDVVRLVMVDVLGWVIIGLGIGAALSLAADALLRHSFAAFGSGILSSLVLAGIALLTVGILAALLPARRAASIEPIQALRSE